MEKKINEVSEEIIDILVSLTKGVLGDVKHKQLLEDLQFEDKHDSRTFIYKFASSLEKLNGKNDAFSTLRIVGRQFSQKLMEIFPENEWNNLFIDSLRYFGFAQKIKKTDNAAFICNCVFYDKLQKDGLEPTEHPICWTGWGLIEGFMKEFENVDGIIWASRNIEKKRCKFDFIRNNETVTFDHS